MTSSPSCLIANHIQRLCRRNYLSSSSQLLNLSFRLFPHKNHAKGNRSANLWTFQAWRSPYLVYSLNHPLSLNTSPPPSPPSPCCLLHTPSLPGHQTEGQPVCHFFSCNIRIWSFVPDTLHSCKYGETVNTSKAEQTVREQPVMIIIIRTDCLPWLLSLESNMVEESYWF